MAGLNTPADLVPWPGDQGGLSNRYSAIDGGELNPAVETEDVAGAVFLVMLQQFLQQDVAFPQDLGPHLRPLEEYLNTWRTATDEELGTILSPRLPTDIAAVLRSTRGTCGLSISATGRARSRPPPGSGRRLTALRVTSKPQ